VFFRFQISSSSQFSFAPFDGRAQLERCMGPALPGAGEAYRFSFRRITRAVFRAIAETFRLLRRSGWIRSAGEHKRLSSAVKRLNGIGRILANMLDEQGTDDLYGRAGYGSL